MEIQNKLILGITDRWNNSRSSIFREINDEEWIRHFSNKGNLHGRFLLALGQYLKHTNKFGRIYAYITSQLPFAFPNGTLGGLTGKVNRSEVDIDATQIVMNEITMESVDFCYPYKIHDHTFATFKPEYKPHIFGIFQTFSLNVWMTLASVFFAITVLSHFVLKYKCKFRNVIFHVFAVLMKQNATIIPSSFAENLLVYSWVIGAMILCLSYDSVFLSFLSIPPLTKVKNLSDLAVAVQKGDYNCITHRKSGMEDFLRNTGQEHLAIIADNLVRNQFRFSSLSQNFVRGDRTTTEIAYFTSEEALSCLSGKFFISEDRFFQVISSMSVRRGFCCKELIDVFVHRMMASGIYFKYFSDFFFMCSSFGGISESETTNRKLTLTDLAPAFIFLLCGYFTSLLVLCWEMMTSRRNRRILVTVEKRRIRSVHSKSSL